MSMVDIPSKSPADAAAPAIAPRRVAMWRRLGGEVARFGTVGLLAFVLDAGVFNILRMGVLSDSPLTAKGISVIVATTFAYVANRHWTYADRARTGAKRETTLFFATNAAALLISWTCLAFSHYLLGLDSQLADNISANIVGVGLGTLFRFWAYRTWVFPEVSTQAASAKSANTLGPNAKGPNTLGPNAEGPNAKGPNTPGPNAEGPNTQGPNAEGPNTQGADELNTGQSVTELTQPQSCTRPAG